MLLLKLAWRNIFRNKRRTIIAGTAIGMGLAMLLFSNGIFIGMIELMTRLATDTFLGQGQIHQEGFRATYEVEKTINDHAAVLDGLSQESIVSAAAPRTLSFSMATSAANVTSILLVGVDPVKERRVSRIADAVGKGKFLEAGDQALIVVGSKLAETLEIGLGDRVVVTAAQAETGELSQEMFRVSGIFQTGEREMDGGLAFVPLVAAQKLLALDERIHEIALRFSDPESAGDQGLSFWNKYSQYGNRAESWKAILPEVAGIVTWVNFGNAIFFGIIFGVVLLIIVNTLFMSLYERMFEFGVLRAVGTRPAGVALIIVYEAASLAAVSMVIGDAVGFAANALFSKIGIDYRGFEFAGVTFTEKLYSTLVWEHYLFYPLIILLFTLIASLYPALFAARLNPAKAMRRSL